MTKYNITSLLDGQRCLVDSESSSKKSVIEKLSHLVAGDLVNVEHKDLFFELIEREKLGSTAIGHGVAIPHARSEKVSTPIGALIKLQQPLEFGADDGVKVDLIFSLIVPAEQDESHLQILATLASIFSNAHWRDRLRQCQNNETLYTTVIELSEQDRSDNNG